MVSLTIISPTRRYQETRLQDHFDKCHRLNCVARLFKKNKNKELLRLGKILCIMCGFQYTSISGLLDLIKCPDTTHRLWCVALPRSARSVCAPGCHSVQKSAQEDPAESRQTDHRVEVTGHFWHSALTDFYVTPVCSLLTALSPSPLKLKKKTVTGGLLAHMCRSAWGPFRPFAIPDALRGCSLLVSVWNFLCLPELAAVLKQELKKSLESFRGALRKFGASWLGEREVGRFENPPYPTPIQHTHTQTPASFKRRERRFREGWQVCVSQVPQERSKKSAEWMFFKCS